ncbi:MAG: AsmA family protein [Paludibacteraceae bacterium]|nr:AsmA family protein [Paludibacteraceae bacterium]
MKRALIITGITLGSLLLVLIAAVLIVIYVVFTPARLTPIARQAAAEYITCEHEIGEVDLTFFSTFPRFGLRADGLLLINPKAGSQNDTVVSAPRFTVTVNLMEFLNNKNLVIHEAILDDASVNFFIAPDGTTNLTDVFVTSPDTTDTTAFSLPFNELRVDGLHIKAHAITFVDAKDTIDASLGITELSAKAESWDDMLIALEANNVCANLKGDTYADSLHVELIAPLAMNLNDMHFAMDGARLAVNDFNLRLEGEATIGDSIALDAKIETDKWQIKPLLALVPEKFTKSLSDLDVDGTVQLEATAQGYYADSVMPHVQAHLILKDGEGKYKPLPYDLRDVKLDAEADLRMNKGEQSNVTIRTLEAKTKKSALAAKGTVEDLLGDMLMDLHLTLDANLPDFAYFYPEKMTLAGRAKGKADARIRLDDLTAMRLDKGRIAADLNLSDIRYATDSMEADLPMTHARIQMPNPQPSKTTLKWARIDLETDKVDFTMATPLTAALKASAIQLETGNVLSDNPVLYAAVGLQSDRPVEVEMDSMGGTVDAPDLKAYVEYNTKSETGLEKAQADISFDGLDGFFQDIKADLKASQLSATMNAGKSLKAKLKTQALNAQMGEELFAKTGDLALDASARYNSKGENVLLKWNPRLKINLKNGEMNMPERLPEPVYIPSIEFSYSNREMNIADARVELGNSDLNLKGNVRNIGKWFRHKEILEGQLDIVSDHCDANQLLAWFSADEGSEESPAAEQTNEKMVNDQMVNEKEPFLVPTDVDLALNTHMREVEIFNQVAKDLKGGLYVKDGKLILDEMGFVCRAAKLQLTAIYRTPRKNHLYLGFDYHMIDVDIDELLTMIPNLEQMVPMLSSFKGAAQFHLAAETYLNSQYQPKISTLRGAASLTGKDLVVMDSKTFSKISKLLLFKKKTENKIDSINAELTVYKDQIDVYPLCVQMDNYMVALGGRHKTDMTFDYDINVLSPIYLGVHVGGSMDNLKIKLAKCKYAKDFKPHWYQKADTQSRELRQLIKQSMEKNVRIQ